MKKLFLIITLSLITVMCTGLGLVGCDWLSGLNPDHTHIPSTNWYSDSTYHWHDCTALGCSEQLDKAEHTLAYVESRQATCTEDGNVEYWYCTVCGKCYADENATTELNTVTLSATGHKIVTEYDESTHWQECEICHTVIVSAQAHSSTSYVKSKSGHYKICDDCGAIYDEGTHIDGEACLICGYTPDYADICSSEYGYNYLGTLEGGTSYQGFYEKIDEVASAFHNDETQTAEPVTFSGGIAYVAGAINYSSFGLSLTQAESVWATYRNDHPLYYWLSGRILYTSQSLSLCVDGDYKDGAVRRAQNEEIYSVIDGYLNAVGGETEAYQIAFAFHDMIIDSIDYARDESGNPVSESWAHGVSGVFAKGEAVCEGYAKAFSLLLNVSGVENVYVTGTSKGEGHAWNMVKIDGEWYWYDLTWDDQPHLGDGIIYDYMCQAGELFADHTVGNIGNMDDGMSFLYALPTAAASAYNSSSLEYGEQFTLNGLTYEVCGYNSVSVIGSSSVSGAVVLADGVTYGEREYMLAQIGSEAFKNNRRITSLTIPQSVTVIYNFAFYGCTLLNNITLADTSGWRRIPNDGETTVYEQIDESSLQSASSAATLLKQTYDVGLTKYQYTWVKAPSA